MTEDKNKAERLGGPHMIQDRDHLSEVGQMGGESKQGGGSRQAEQSQADTRQRGSGQQGGERGYKRRKFL
jgi:general stress protein YciG